MNDAKDRRQRVKYSSSEHVLPFFPKAALEDLNFENDMAVPVRRAS